MESFKEYLEKKGYSRKYIETGLSRTESFKSWLEAENIPEGSETYNDLLLWVKGLTASGKAKATTNGYLRTLRHYYNYLIGTEQAAHNPAGSITVRGETKTVPRDILSSKELEKIYESYPSKTLTEQRNKTLLGLVIWQGLTVQELEVLEPSHLKLREGKILILAGRRTAERELKLESHQIIDLMEYVHSTRKELLKIRGKESKKLFISTGTSDTIKGQMEKIYPQLRKVCPGVKNLKQIRASVITNWLKVHNLRRVQYMAGHRYVSSTEKYQLNNLEDLKEDINKYHPMN